MLKVVRLALVLVILIGCLATAASPGYAAVSGYKFPWPAGEQAYMRAGPSWHDGDLALDFDIGGHAYQGAVLAAKGGQVVFRKDTSTISCQPRGCNWQYANMVVIRHAANEFSWYLHLAPSSIPAGVQEGAAVAQGAVIGREGRTGWSTNVHLHFHVTSTFGGVIGSGDLRAPAWQSTFQEVHFDEMAWSSAAQVGWKTSQNSGGVCPAPTLIAPSAGQALTERRVAFRWQALGCGQGYTLRIKDVSSMDTGGTQIYDSGHGETSVAVEVPAQWLDRDLFWGVRAANAPMASWSVQRFRITSAPQPECTPASGQAVLFEHAGYTGRCTLLGAGAYRDSGSMSFGNDATSSIRVGSGLRVTLYEHSDYNGRSESFTGDDPNLSDNTIGNDAASSVRVEPWSGTCPAPTLGGPADGEALTHPAVSFSWSPPAGCSFQGYTFRIKDTASMEQGGTVLVDTGVGAATFSYAVPQEWHGRDLYWGVRTANPLSPSWAVRRFRVTPPSETDPQAISSGQALDGRIDPANEDDTFTFTATQGQRATITMDRTSGSQLDSYIELFGPGGLVGYNDDSNGTFNSRLDVTLPAGGAYRIVARSYNRASAGAYRVGLSLSAASGDGDDGRWLRFGETTGGSISPASDRDTYYFSAAAGRVVSLRMNSVATGLDSYLELYAPSGAKIAENDDSGGGLNSWVVADLPVAGTYRVVARSWGGSSGGSYNLQLEAVNSTNLARGKQAFASSVERNLAALSPASATDGNGATRWSSAFTDSQWIYIDLGSDVPINQVVLRWERAFADSYVLLVRGSNEGGWRPVYSTSNGDGNVDTISFAPTTARYVMMQGRHRYAHGGWQQFGYSLWELEVYNTLAALVPTVPPDSDDKGDEGLAPLAPLPPDPTDKEPGLLSQGTEQENMPTADTTVDTPLPQVEPGVPYVPPVVSITLSADRATGGDTPLVFTAERARDGDEPSDGIIAYEWRSSLDGFLGTTQRLTIPTNGLSVGLHLIELRVQDNEGSWSEPATAVLEILPPEQAPGETVSRLFLPLTRR